MYKMYSRQTSKIHELRVIAVSVVYIYVYTDIMEASSSS